MTGTSHITTHVLDAAEGIPAQGISVRLDRHADGWTTVAAGRTDADGRITDLGPATLDPGTYRLTFDTGTYFASASRPSLYPSIDITVDVATGVRHLHIPILLSPFAFTTYRGS